MTRRGSAFGWAAIDTLTCLILIIFIAVAPPPKPATAPTLGLYAVTAQWPAGNDNDVDLYVRDPQGNIAYFNSLSSTDQVMHLEHDDLGATEECSGNKKCLTSPNGERTIIRQLETGEYVVNVQMYLQTDPHPTPVTIQLWSLAQAGNGPITSTTITLTSQGEVRTAFRFVLAPGGNVQSINHLPLNIVTKTVG